MRKIIAILMTPVVMTVFSSCSRIDAGHVGLKINMAGGDKGVSNVKYVTGYVWYMPGMSKIEEVPTFVQHKEYDEIEVYAKGGIKWMVKPSMNYQTVGEKADSMYQKFRVGLRMLEDGWMKNVVYQACRDIMNTFDSDSLLNHRGNFEVALEQELNNRFQPYFTAKITSGLKPPAALAASIERKTVSIQEKQAAENQRGVVIAQGETNIAQARADSTVKMINTQAEANAIGMKQKVLRESPNYIDLIKAEKWDGHLPQITSGAGMMLQLPAK